MSVRATGALLIVAACLTATACTSGGTTPKPSPSHSGAPDMPSLLSGMFVPLGPIESLTGAVVSKDGCVGFRELATGSTAPLLWPPATYMGPGAQSVVLLNGSIVVDAPLTMNGARIQAKELWADTEGVAECAPDPEQSVIVVTGLPDILMQQ